MLGGPARVSRPCTNEMLDVRRIFHSVTQFVSAKDTIMECVYMDSVCVLLNKQETTHQFNPLYSGYR